MQRPSVCLVVGTRPQLIKAAQLVEAHRGDDHGYDLSVVDTGQHYDANLASSVTTGLEDRQILEPRADDRGRVGLDVMISVLERHLRAKEPDHVLTIGDTNSTLATTLAATELEIGLTHIEAGLRSGDRGMPEERNRIVADHLSDLLLAPSESALRNLDSEGLTNRSTFTGDLSYDRLLAVSCGSKFSPRERWGDPAVLLTLHRPSNLSAQRLVWITELVRFIASRARVLFPIHPRTASVLGPNLAEAPGLQLVEPLTHSATLEAIASADLVVTDSGGIQREAFWLSRRCLTLRDQTEWLETLEGGRNSLLMADTWETQILDALAEPPLPPPPPCYGSGQAAQEILTSVNRHLFPEGIRNRG